MRQIKTLLVSFLLFPLLSISSCNKNEPCFRCEDTVDSIFTDTYFQVMLNANSDFILTWTDSVSNVSESYEMCSTNLLNGIETTKIIKATGNFKYACGSKSNKLIELNEFEVIEICLPSIDQINATFSLHNDWMLHYIQTGDTIIFPPCEGYSNIIFDTQQNIMEGSISFNWFNGSYIEIDETTIQLPETFSLGLGIGTLTQIYFEKIFLEVLEPNAVITYSIDKNFLTLSNMSKNSFIKLYLKP